MEAKRWGVVGFRGVGGGIQGVGRWESRGGRGLGWGGGSLGVVEV